MINRRAKYSFIHSQLGSVFLLAMLLLPEMSNAQSQYTIGSDLRYTSDDKIGSSKKGRLSLELTASMLPKAKISRTEGDYVLKSHIQSAYSVGVNYNYSFNKKTVIISGMHFVLGKWNYFLDVPSQDVNQYRISGRKIAEGKELWSTIRIPLVVDKDVKFLNKEMIVRGGISLRYSGLMRDVLIRGGGVIDSNNQVIRIFSASFSGKNDYKPWITFIAGLGKKFSLSNKNEFSIYLIADISTKYFFRGNYQITIPNKPITYGAYKLNGASLGLSVQYIFTGYNKRIVKEFEKERF